MNHNVGIWIVAKVRDDALVEARFLCVKPNGTYARAIDGRDVPRPRSVRAELGPGARAGHGFMTTRRHARSADGGSMPVSLIFFRSVL
jgi:hypothetical protein